MAKKGSTRPWRVRFEWTSAEGEATRTTKAHGSYEDARAFVRQLEAVATGARGAALGMRVVGGITHRDGAFRVGGRVVESVTFEYGPEAPAERVEPDVDDAAPVVRATDDPRYDEAEQQAAEGSVLARVAVSLAAAFDGDAAHDLGGHMLCDEVDSLARALVLTGNEEPARALLRGHAAQEDCAPHDALYAHGAADADRAAGAVAEHLRTLTV